MTRITAKKKKERDGHEIAGKIITAFFALLLIAGTWFLVDLFRDRELNYDNLAGNWKLSGDPDMIYTFEPFDENQGFGKATIRIDGETDTTTYRYVMTDKSGSNYKLIELQPIDIGGYKAGKPVYVTITGISKAQLSCIIEDSKMKSMTRQDIF